MLQNIPTHVITGPLGAGKTSLIRQLLAQRPDGERWAVLINEFGQIGLDAALLATADDGIALGEVAGGCLCCVNGAPFQVGLGRLLRKSKPHRLFIEPSGLGHPAQLLKQLAEAPWRGVLALQPSVMVLDAAALACGQLIPEAQASALPGSGLLVLNKSAQLNAAQRLWITQQLPDIPLHWTENAHLGWAMLPMAAVVAAPIGDNFIPVPSYAQLPDIWPADGGPICAINSQAEGWSIGWRWPPTVQFDGMQVEQWLQGLDYQRAKLVIHTSLGWQSINAVDNSQPLWKNSEWRRDSRFELIFAVAQDRTALTTGLAQTRSLCAVR